MTKIWQGNKKITRKILATNNEMFIHTGSFHFFKKYWQPIIKFWSVLVLVHKTVQKDISPAHRWLCRPQFHCFLPSFLCCYLFSSEMKYIFLYFISLFFLYSYLLHLIKISSHLFSYMNDILVVDWWLIISW